MSTIIHEGRKIEEITPLGIRLLALLKSSGGAVMTSEWAEGSGRRTRLLDVPPYSKRIERWEYKYQPKRIKKVFDAHPRCQAVIAIVDMGSATRLLNALH